MTEDRKEQIRFMLVDIADNMEKPDDFEGSQDDFKREWLHAVAEEATTLAKEVPFN